MKKKLSFYGKTFLMLFLMCLVTGTAFANEKFTITPGASNPTAVLTTDANSGLKFSAVCNPGVAGTATLDANKVHVYAHGTTTPVVGVTLSQKDEDNFYELKFSENLGTDNAPKYYFSTEEVNSVAVDIVFDDEAWSETTGSNTEKSLKETITGVTVYDAPDFQWRTTSFQVWEGNTDPYKLTFTVVGKRSGVTFTPATNGKKASITGTSVKPTEPEGAQAKTYNLTPAMSNVAYDSDNKNWSVDVAAESMMQDNAAYVLKVPEKAIKVAYGNKYIYSTAITNGSIEVWAKPTITMTSTTPANVGKDMTSFTFDVSGNLASGRSYENGRELKYVGSTDKTKMSLAISGTNTNNLKADNFEITNATVEGVNTVTVKLKNLAIFAGGEVITISIPKGAYEANGLKNEAALTSFVANIKGATYNAPTVVTSAQGYVGDDATSVVVNIPVVYNGTTAAAPVALASTYSINIQNTTTGKSQTKIQTDNAVSFGSTDETSHQLTISGLELGAGSYVITFPANTFVSCGDNNTYMTSNFTVKTSVTYPTATTIDVTAMNDEDKTLTFTATPKDKDKKVLAYTLADNAILVNGSTDNVKEFSQPVAIKDNNDAITGYKVTVKLKEALKSGYNSVGIIAGGMVVANASADNEAITKYFKVAEHITFTVTPALNDFAFDKITFTVATKTSSTSQEVTGNVDNNVTTIKIGDNTYKPTITSGKNGREMTVTIIDEDYETVVGGISQNMTKKNLRAFVAAGNFKFSIDADKMEINGTKNLAITDQEIPVTEYNPASPQTVSSLVEKTYDVTLLNEAFTVNSSNTIKLYLVPATGDKEVVTGATFKASTKPGILTITTTAALTDDANYQLVIPAANLCATAETGTININEVKVTFTPKAIFDFYDATTTADDVTNLLGSENNRVIGYLNYKRTFAESQVGKACPLYVPFDIYAHEVADEFSILKLNDVSEQEGSLVFHFNTLDPTKHEKAADDAIAYANMPYIMIPKSTNLEITFEKKDIVKPVDNTSPSKVQTETSSTTYNFYGNTSSDTKLDNIIELNTNGKLSTFTTETQVKAWRWYIKTTPKSINYAKIVIDGNEISGDEATAIKSVMSESVNNANGAIYNLGGQRVSAPVKGQVYIINGKKIRF